MRIRGSTAWVMLLWALWLASMGAAWAAQVGVVERLEGTARISGPSGERRAAVNLAVEEGDRIATERDAELVLRMNDGAVIALRPQTSIELTEYRYRSGNDGSVVNLFRGAMRTVTGLIAKNDRDKVTVKTATATIGVRGTDFEVVLVDAEAAAQARAQGQNDVDEGTYNRVYSGGTYLEGEGGRRVDVMPNQVAFAPLDVLRAAQQFGLLRGLPPIFRIGRYDNVLDAIQGEALRRIEQELRRAVPNPLQNLVPALPDIFRRR